MSIRFPFIVLLVFLVSLSACTSGADKFEQAGKKFVKLLEDEQFQEAVGSFDQTMTEKLPEEKLEEIWNQLLEKSGTFQSQLSTRRETYLQYEIVFVTCQFANGKLDIKVVYNESLQVAGLFFVPSQTQ